RETFRRDLSGDLIDGVSELVRKNLCRIIGRQIVADVDGQRLAGTAIYVSTTKVLSHLARRRIRRDSANERLCEGVKLRWREGFFMSAHHSSTDHVLGDERSS